ncbi:MAG: MBL fold metallo-hydrolase [Anaerolineae bacterium]|nr:MBL fold metallo-hydrolase [Anaerolineae bacterium]
MIDRIQWLGHGSYRIQGPPLIYINPWRIARAAFHADVILISNDQYDHCSPADVFKLCGPQTVIIGNPGAAAVLGDNVIVLRPWQSYLAGDARITAVPAYTFTNHHPVSKGGIGFIVSIDYYDLYYAGVTDIVPELNSIQADIAVLPVAAGPGTMTLDRTVDWVRRTRPGWVLPSHWGTVGGTYLDAQALDRALGNEAKVVLPEKIR